MDYASLDFKRKVNLCDVCREEHHAVSGSNRSEEPIGLCGWYEKRPQDQTYVEFITIITCHCIVPHRLHGANVPVEFVDAFDDM
jgi:hypothetical protein